MKDMKVITDRNKKDSMAELEERVMGRDDEPAPDDEYGTRAARLLASVQAAGIKTAFCTFGFDHLNESRYTIKINRMDELLRHCKAEE